MRVHDAVLPGHKPGQNMETNDMSTADHAWLRYAELQQRSRNVERLSDYSWGLESGLNSLLKSVETGAIPSEPADLDAALTRAIASGARLCRSHSLALRTWLPPPESSSINTAAEARIELTEIENSLSSADRDLLIDAALGYSDREIAALCESTPGAVRVRLSRLRAKLAAAGFPRRHSATATGVLNCMIATSQKQPEGRINGRRSSNLHK